MTEDRQLSYNELISSFLKAYVVIPKSGLKDDGTVTDEYIRLSLRFLLDEEVFDDPADLRHDAFAEYGILIPDSMMEL